MLQPETGRRPALRFPLLPHLAGLVLATGLAGCSGILESDSPPNNIWWLEPAVPSSPSTPPSSSGRADRSGLTLVLDLTVVPGLDTDQILNLGPDARLNHYAGAHWPDHLPEVLSSVLMRSFEEAGWAEVRLGQRATPPEECLARLETRAFFGRVNQTRQTNQVEVRFEGDLRCGETTRPLSTAQTVPVMENRMGAIVRAFQTGLNRSADELSAAMTP